MEQQNNLTEEQNLSLEKIQEYIDTTPPEEIREAMKKVENSLTEEEAQEISKEAKHLAKNMTIEQFIYRAPGRLGRKAHRKAVRTLKKHIYGKNKK